MSSQSSSSTNRGIPGDSTASEGEEMYQLAALANSPSDPTSAGGGVLMASFGKSPEPSASFAHFEGS